MRIGKTFSAACAAVVVLFASTLTWAGSAFQFTTGNPDGLIATASRPDGSGKIETETADDFLLPKETILDGATFTGLLTGGATTADVLRVTVDIYRVFPLDSDTSRTITVPTRANSPGDVEIDGRDTIDNNLAFSTTVLNANFAAGNSVVNGIHPSPNQLTNGEGPVSGTEVRFNLTFSPALDLLVGHYFFRPEVEVSTGEFLWLSAPRPIVAPGTPFLPDLQTWIRNANLAPDWLRVGGDITGTGPFNAAFSLSGKTVPLPPAVWPAAGMLAALGVTQWVRARRLARS